VFVTTSDAIGPDYNVGSFGLSLGEAFLAEVETGSELKECDNKSIKRGIDFIKT